MQDIELKPLVAEPVSYTSGNRGNSFGVRVENHSEEDVEQWRVALEVDAPDAITIGFASEANSRDSRVIPYGIESDACVITHIQVKRSDSHPGEIITEEVEVSVRESCEDAPRADLDEEHMGDVLDSVTVEVEG
jgi:hypothetical protein